VILRSLFDAKSEIYDVPVETMALSQHLNTKAIYLIEEDTSGAIAYKLCENGERIEYFEEACDEDFSFESKLREQPDIKFHDWDRDENDDEEMEDDSEAEYDEEKMNRNMT
jgi:hypothetical protein